MIVSLHVCALTMILLFCDCASIDSRLNTIDRSNKKSLFDEEQQYETDGDSDKCEIKITTRGVCTVNSEIIRPKIVVKYMKGSKNNNTPNIDSKRLNNHKSLDEQKGNDLVDQFLAHFKLDFGDKIDPILIESMADFTFENWGSAKLYQLTLSGISNVKRVGSVSVHTDNRMKQWSVQANLSISNITADFKVDAKLKNRIYVKGWQLKVLIQHCVLNTVILYDETTKLMSIQALTVSVIEGFRLQTERLSWPFDQLVNQIITNQKENLKSIITTNAQKYMSETIKSFNVADIIKKMRLN